MSKSVRERLAGVLDAHAATLGAGLILILLAVIYRHVGKYYFTGEDFFLLLTGKFWVQGASPLYFDHIYGFWWRPLGLYVWRWTVLMFGKDPTPHYLFNVAVHLFNTGLLYKFLRELGLKRGAGWGALLFTAHPIATATTLYLTARYDLCGMGFAFIALWAALRWTIAPSRKTLALTCFATLFATFAKETYYVLPVLFAIIAFSHGDALSVRERMHRCMRFAVLPAVIVCGVFVWRYNVIGGLGGYLHTQTGGGLLSIVGAPPSWSDVLYDTVLGLSGVSMHFAGSEFSPPATAALLIAVGCIAVVVLVLWRGNATARLAMLLFVPVFLITLPAGQTIGEYPRLLYFETMVCMIIAGAVLETKTIARSILGTVAASVLLTGSLASSRSWLETQSNLTLYNLFEPHLEPVLHGQDGARRQAILIAGFPSEVYYMDALVKVERGWDTTFPGDHPLWTTDILNADAASLVMGQQAAHPVSVEPRYRNVSEYHAGGRFRVIERNSMFFDAIQPRYAITVFRESPHAKYLAYTDTFTDITAAARERFATSAESRETSAHE